MGTVSARSRNRLEVGPGRADRKVVRRSALLVGRRSDPAEAGADLFADRVLQDLSWRPSVARTSAGGYDELGGRPVSADIESRIRRAAGGSRLSADLRATAEAHSGRDLSDVRVIANPEAAALNSALQASAFTVGTKVFLGSGAPRPGTAAGDALLGHELGHVVQQGGGTPRVQRRFGFGKAKPAATSVRATAEKSKTKQVVTVGDLQKQIETLESAQKKLVKHHKTGDKSSQDAAYSLRSAAQQVIDNLPDQTSKQNRMLGRQYPAQIKRLQRIIDEAQIIWDEHLVEMTKRKAANIYLAAGRNESGKPGALAQLTDTARDVGFSETPKRPTGIDDDRWSEHVDARAQGKLLGLTPAEFAAIFSFTVEDYKYINPGTANDAEWMKAVNPSSPNADAPTREKELAQKHDEGPLHAAFAVGGLEKLPPWKGRVYRGEIMTPARFDEVFRPAPSGSGFEAIKEIQKQATFASMSTQEQTGRQFGIPPASALATKIGVVWITDVIDGRDIAMLSGSRNEAEILTLPGSVYAIESVTEKKSKAGRKYFEVIRTQKPPDR